MQLIDSSGVLKDWNTLKHEHYVQNNLYFQWMQLISVIAFNCKNFIKQKNGINMFKTTEHRFIQNSRVLTIQKVTSKELYWILITTIEHKPVSQKYFRRKLFDLSLARKKW